MKTTLKTDSHTRTRTRNHTRRLSACNRHPDEPVTGICAACLRERLSGLDPSAAADASSSSFSATEELRRCRSVSSAAAKCEASCNSYNELPRRKSCDVRARNTLADHLLFDKSGPIGLAKAESTNLGFGNDNDNAEVAEGEGKTMKEHIDLVLQSEKHQKKPKDLTSFWEAASVFSKKLQNWRIIKHKNRKLGQGNASSGVDDGDLKPRKMGQRESTRFSVDAGRLSVDESRISFDEPRASRDGYMIARTIPRLAPLISVVENGMLWGGNRFDCHRLSVDGQMQSIVEDESSPCGGSGQSNFDSSSSQRWSSFDRSVSLTGSSKKTLAGLESDEANSMSPAKLVITEKELKDWRSKSSVNKDDNCGNFEPIGKAATSGEGGGNFNVSKKSTRWRKMFNVLSMIPKSSENKCENLTGNEEESSVADGCEGRKNGGEVKEPSGCKHTGSDSVAKPRKSFDMFGFNQSMRNGGEVKEASSWKLERSDSVARSRNSFDVSGLNQSMRNGGEVKEASGWKLAHCSSLASSRRSLDMIGLNNDTRSLAKDTFSANKGREDFVLELNKSARNSSCKIDDDALPFYLTPLRSSKTSKSSRHRPQNSLSLNENILQLN